MRSPLKTWALTAVLGLLTGSTCAWAFLNGQGVLESVSASAGGAANTPRAQEAKEELDPVSQAALRYATALQEGDCDTAMACTLWMRQRLDNALLHSSNLEAVEDAKERLRERLLDRAPEQNCLMPGGLADQYIFAPGTRIEVVRCDEGEAGLSAPVAGRAWLRVEFPLEENAPLGPNGKPIRSFLVGLNISEDGSIVKAGIRGNGEIRLSSLQYDWPRKEG